MKLPKSLLQTIAVAVSMTAMSACSEESLSPFPDTVIMENADDNSVALPPTPIKVEKVPEYYDCPACGMG